MLEGLLEIIIIIPIVLVIGYFYRKTNKYEEKVKEEQKNKEITKKEEKESEELENFINLYQEKINKE